MPGQLQQGRQRLLQAAEGDWPYRRELAAHEAASGVDVPDLDYAGHLSLERMIAAWTPLRALHVAELIRQVTEATDAPPPGDATWIGTLNLPQLDTSNLEAGVLSAIEEGRTLALDEARHQDPRIAVRAAAAPRPSIDARISAYTRGAERLLAASLVQTASREAFRLTATTATVDTPGHVATVLGKLPMVYEKDILGGMATGGVNEGRYEIMAAALGTHPSNLEAAEHFLTGKPEPTDSLIYALEILDGNTCEECAAVDGKQYATLDDAREDYPGIGGGYVACLGRERCRGSLVIVYGDEAPATLQTFQGPPAPPEPPPAQLPLPEAEKLAEIMKSEKLANLLKSVQASQDHPIGAVRIYDGDTENPVVVLGHLADGRVLVQNVNDSTEVFRALADDLIRPLAPAPVDALPLPSGAFPQLSEQERLRLAARHALTISGDEFREAASVADRNAVGNYSGISYRPMNKLLRGEDIHKEGWGVPETERSIEALKAAFERAPELHEDVLTTRGMSIIKGSDMVDQIVTDPAFISTSANRDTAIGGFANGRAREGREKAVFNLFMRKGVKFIPVSIGEEELLLPPGTRYLITEEIAPVEVSGGRLLRQFNAIVLLPGEGLVP